jgi:hypothetical protein
MMEASTLENEIVLISDRGSKHRLEHLDGSPYAVIAFCEDALGNYLAIIYYDKMSSPVDGSWSISDRIWQNENWSKDVISYFFDRQRKILFVSTSEIYGEGGIYRLDLMNRKYEKLTPNTPKEGKIYELKSVDVQKRQLKYIVTLDGEVKEEAAIPMN